MKKNYILLLIALLPFLFSCEVEKADSAIKTEQGYRIYSSWNNAMNALINYSIIDNALHVNAIVNAASDTERNRLINEFYYNGKVQVEGPNVKLYLENKDKPNIIIYTKAKSLNSNNTTWDIKVLTETNIQSLGLSNDQDYVSFTITRSDANTLTIKSTPNAYTKDYYLNLSYKFSVDKLPNTLYKMPYTLSASGKVQIHPYRMNLRQTNTNDSFWKAANSYSINTDFDTKYTNIYSFETSEPLKFDSDYWNDGLIQFDVLNFQGESHTVLTQFKSKGVAYRLTITQNGISQEWDPIENVCIDFKDKL